jgi:hypothetical protein
MAARYWVGGANTWNTTAGTKWATTSGGASGAAAPTVADDVFLDAASGAVVVALGSVSCRSLDCTGFTGTLSHPGAIDFFIGDATPGAGNVALRLAAGMTYTLGSSTSSTTSFQSTSATQQIIDFAGKTCGLFTTGTGASGGSWLLSTSLVQNNASTLGHSRGTLDFNNVNHSIGSFSSTSTNTRTINLGSSQITVTGNSWNTSTTTGLTFSAGTSSIIFNPTASVTPSFGAGNIVYYDLSIVKSAGGFSINQSLGFHNFTQDNTVLGGGNRILAFDNGATISVSGTLTYVGNNATDGRGRLVSNVSGLTTTLSLGPTGTLALTNIDIEDVTVTGTNTPVAATAGRIGNGGGNAGFNFSAPVTYYWIGDGGAMTLPVHYSTSSGGASGSVIPLIHDTLIFDSNSITSAGQTVIADMMRSPGLDFTNVLNNPTFNPRNPNGAGNGVYGSLILKSGMSYSLSGAAGSATAFAFRGRAGYSLDQAGIDLTVNTSFSINAPSGTYALASNLTMINPSGFGVTSGTFTASGFNVSVVAFNSSNTNVRTVNMGSGIWTLSGTGAVWSTGTATNFTLNASTSTVLISDTSATSKTLSRHPGIVLNNVTVAGGTGLVIFSNATTSTMNNLAVTTPPANIRFNAPATYTILGSMPSGTSGNLVTIDTNTGGTTATISKSSGIVSCDYLSLRDSLATGGAAYYAGSNSTIVSNVIGWAMYAPPAGFGNLMQAIS